MKKNLFVFAAIAMLVMGCAKEQQPNDTQIPADEQKTYLKIVETKATVGELGAVAWQEGDILHAWFKPEEGDGVLMDFVYEGTFEDGSAKFATTGSVPAQFTAAKLTSASGIISATGGFSLVRDYVYDPDSVPVYVRTEQVERNEDGTLSANLVHNASIMQFTLRDIPAYAAGFVLRTSSNIEIKTTFPYKTGYDKDIVLHTVVPNSRTVEKFYLIDGDGDEIEGTVKTFTQSPTSSSNEFIEMGLVDFQKANLRKDYVKVCGIKWAKGNLVYDKNHTYNVVQTGVDDNFQTGWGLHDEQWKYINWDKSLYVEANSVKDYTRHAYTNNDFCDVFTWGGIGRMATYRSGRMVTDVAEFDIQKKVYWGYVNEKIEGDATVATSKSNPSNLTLLEGDACFSSELDRSNNACYTKDGVTKNIAGDIAFWASKGKYCLPNSTDIKNLSHATSSLASFQYGKYVKDGKTIVGVLYTTPILKGEVVRNMTEVTFTDADLESGLFLPLNGRRSPNNNNTVINQGSQAIYRCSNFGNPAHANAIGKHEQCARVLWFEGTNLPVYGFTSGSNSVSNDGFSYTCTLSAAAGGAIRPILVD